MDLAHRQRSLHHFATDKEEINHNSDNEIESKSRELNAKCFSKTADFNQTELRLQQSQSHPSQHSNQQKSFSCFRNSASNFYHFWDGPVKFFQIVARELSVLLILIETLILLVGYLMILALHHSIRYLLKKLRYDFNRDTDRVSYMPPRNYNYQLEAQPGVVPRRVPRGRMAGG